MTQPTLLDLQPTRCPDCGALRIRMNRMPDGSCVHCAYLKVRLTGLPNFWDAPAPTPPIEPEKPVRAERQRLTANARRLLEQLKRGPLLTHQLANADFGSDGSRRLRELRSDGWLIEKTRLSPGTYRYTLVGPKPLSERRTERL